MQHVMSPTSTAALLLLALVIDYMSVGPTGLRDRLAFLMAVPAIREGFNGSQLDVWTVQQASALIDYLKSQAGNAYIAGAATQMVLGVAVGCLAIYAVGCLVPDRWSKKLGRFAGLKFRQSQIYRLNWPLWVMAILLGMLADLPGGVVGELTQWAVNGLVHLFAPLPNVLFGAN